MGDTRLHQLALKIADSVARSDVECYAIVVGRGGRYSTAVPKEDEDREALADALEYLDLRGDALPYRCIHDGDTISFESIDPKA